MTMNSCIRCRHFIRCKDARKAITFSCERFGISKESLTTEAEFLSEALEMPFTTSKVTGIALPSGYEPADPNDTDSSFNASTVLNDMLEDKRIVSPDLKIPEGDFLEAPNFYTWCASDKFLDQKPFVMQALIGVKLFSEYCPDCSDVEWMEQGVRVNDSLGKLTRKVALLEYGKCPYCKKTKLDFYRRGTLNPYYELSLSAGQRSGKSALFGMMASYLTHRMIKLERPNEVFGLLKANVLQGTFVALTHQQAKETLYEPFYGHLLDAPWFQAYHEMLNQVQGHHGEDSVYKLKDTFVFYRHRRIQVYPAGPDKRILRGRTRFVSGIDELGWFPNDVASDKNVKMNANQVYIALERSLLTVRAKAKAVVKSGFYNVPFGYFINISSPSSVRDKIMELVRKAQGSTRTLGMCLPTWKMNPHVPRSALAEEFRNDPEAAMRDYGAQPPLTNSPFISSHEKVESCFSKKVHYFKQIYHVVKSRDKTSSEIYTELDDVIRSGKASVMALDAGYSGNSFAFACGHLAKNGYPVISLVGEIMPQPGVRINHSLVYSELLADLIPERNVVLISADRWNSLKVLADAEQEFEIEKRQHSLKYVDMQLFKSYIDDGQILLPRPSKPIAEIVKYNQSEYPKCFKHLPADHLALQMLTVQDTGSAILKGDQLTDDILRAVMLCFRMLVDEDNFELLTQADSVTENMDMSKMAVSKHYSGGGSMGSGSGMGGGQSASSLGTLRQRQG